MRFIMCLLMITLTPLTTQAVAAAVVNTDGDAKPVSRTCPPCGCANDGEDMGSAETCEHCGMATVELMTHHKEVNVGADLLERKRYRVGILVFDNVQIIDYTAPYEVFGQAGFEVVLIAKTKEEISTVMGMKVNPHHDFKSAPNVDILVVPGGGVRAAVRDKEVVDWVKKTAESSEYVLSVCNGAFILAETGLLDGRSATTFYGLIDTMTQQYPKVKVLGNQRYVDNGKFITTAGLSSGMDGSLYVVSKVRGLDAAQRAALNMEYDWKEHANYARANFADQYLRGKIVSRRFYPMLTAPNTEWSLESLGGDQDQFKITWKVTGSIDINKLKAAWTEKLTKDGKWAPTKKDNLWNLPQKGFKGELTMVPGENSSLFITLEVSNKK